MFKTQVIQTFIRQALLGKAGTDAIEQFGITAFSYPACTQFYQAGMHIKFRLRIAIRTGSVVYRNGFVGLVLWVVFVAAKQRRAKLDFTHRHLQIVA
ncbi:hypothetical protein D3C76_1480260 [compost metagenome]